MLLLLKKKQFEIIIENERKPVEIVIHNSNRMLEIDTDRFQNASINLTAYSNWFIWGFRRFQNAPTTYVAAYSERWSNHFGNYKLSDKSVLQQTGK